VANNPGGRSSSRPDNRGSNNRGPSNRGSSNRGPNNRGPNNRSSNSRGPKKSFRPGQKVNPLNSLFKDTGSKFERPEPYKKPERVKIVPRERKAAFEIIDGIDPEELFCAYHLGITREDTYKPQNIHDLGRRFRTSPSRVHRALKEYELDAETVMNTDFDMAMAQIDIKVSPPGVSKKELGKQLFKDFLEADRIIRDWAGELKNDAAENEKIFEKLK
jgi:hypothetical protein